MPSRGSNEGSVFLQDKQAMKFRTPQPIQQHVTDKSGREWPLYFGSVDSEEKNYGLFDDSELIAHVTLVGPDVDSDCPTGYWIIGRIAVATAYQGKGIGPALAETVCKSHGLPLASDLNQSEGGAALWERLIRDNPGRIELHDGKGGIELVQVVDGRLKPDPWAHRDRRLVRRF